MGRLFELTSLRLSLPKQICASTTIPLMYQWHLRLGHASASKLRSLVSNGSLGLSKFESFNCLHCQLAKQPALSFNTLLILITLYVILLLV